MSDANQTSVTDDSPCFNCPRTDCTGCQHAPVFLTTPFFVHEPPKKKKGKKKTWMEKQIRKHGWR